MIFPIGDDQVKGGHQPYISYLFIAVNIAVFFYQASLHPEALEQFVFDYGAIPGEISQGVNLHTMFTSMFMHGGWMHLIGNMVFLWIFADNIEATIGSVGFLIFYLVGGLAAQVGHIWYNPASSVVTLGASGAISAVMGAYMIMFPRSRIKTLVFFFVVYIPAFLYLGFWIFQQFASGTAELANRDAEVGGVAWWAHIGGFIFGVLLGFFLRRWKKSPEQVYQP